MNWSEGFMGAFLSVIILFVFFIWTAGLIWIGSIFEDMWEKGKLGVIAYFIVTSFILICLWIRFGIA